MRVVVRIYPPPEIKDFVCEVFGPQGGGRVQHSHLPLVGRSKFVQQISGGGKEAGLPHFKSISMLRHEAKG